MKGENKSSRLLLLKWSQHIRYSASQIGEKPPVYLQCSRWEAEKGPLRLYTWINITKNHAQIPLEAQQALLHSRRRLQNMLIIKTPERYKWSNKKLFQGLFRPQRERTPALDLLLNQSKVARKWLIFHLWTIDVLKRTSSINQATSKTWLLGLLWQLWF